MIWLHLHCHYCVMGLFDIRTERKDEQAIVTEQKKQKLWASEKIHRGHRIFEYDEVSKVLTEIKQTGHKYQLLPDKTLMKRTAYQARENCIYIAALNRKNAILKLFKNHNITFKDNDVQRSKKRTVRS